MDSGNKARIEGYGPSNLIDRLQKFEWTPCTGEGENFHGFSLGGYCLTRPADDLCPIEYRVTARNMKTGQGFFKSGFCYSDTIRGFSANVAKKGVYSPNKVASRRLSKTPTRSRGTLYEVVVEVI